LYDRRIIRTSYGISAGKIAANSIRPTTTDLFIRFVYMFHMSTADCEAEATAARQLLPFFFNSNFIFKRLHLTLCKCYILSVSVC